MSTVMMEDICKHLVVSNRANTVVFTRWLYNVEQESLGLIRNEKNNKLNPLHMRDLHSSDNRKKKREREVLLVLKHNE